MVGSQNRCGATSRESQKWRGVKQKPRTQNRFYSGSASIGQAEGYRAAALADRGEKQFYQAKSRFSKSVTCAARTGFDDIDRIEPSLDSLGRTTRTNPTASRNSSSKPWGDFLRAVKDLRPQHRDRLRPRRRPHRGFRDIRKELPKTVGTPVTRMPQWREIRRKSSVLNFTVSIYVSYESTSKP
jgi:hypothetical protein